MNERYIIPSLDRSFDVLELLTISEHGMSLADLSRETEIPKSTLFRILITLEKHRCVKQDVHGKFILGSRLWELGGHFLDSFDPYHAASSHMRALAEESGETVFMGKYDEGKVLYVHRMESKKSVAIVKRLGQRVPMHATATGMAILAYMNEEEIESIFKKYPLEAHNEATVTSHDILHDRLEEIRALGYAVVNGEYERDLLCVSAPVFNHIGQPNASLTVAMLSSQVVDDVERIEWVGNLVKTHATALTLEMGGSGRARLMQTNGTLV